MTQMTHNVEATNADRQQGHSKTPMANRQIPNLMLDGLREPKHDITIKQVSTGK